MSFRPARHRLAVAAMAMLAVGHAGRPASAQSRPGASSPHVVIPFLANATKPADLDFQGGECEVETGGASMSCTFQQVFLTTSAAAPDTCLITTNRYDRVFRRETATRWVSTEGPEGICGVLDVATLLDEGGVRWTLEIRKRATKKNASAACSADDPQPEMLSWQNIRRPLPCRFVQPGGLSR
jgi:hypothetical protein